MKARLVLVVLVVSCFALAGALMAMETKSAAKPWAMNATIIEACSCPMFCQCYFSTAPASHAMAGMEGHSEAYCKFNNAFRVNRGTYNGVSLAGAKFWVAGTWARTSAADRPIGRCSPSIPPSRRRSARGSE